MGIYLTTLVVIGTNVIGRPKSTYHTNLGIAVGDLVIKKGGL
jgi:hypothetical protein